jgi:monomeric isocitrate dehydrogenase
MPVITAKAGTPSIQETSSGSASDTRKNIMFKSLNTDWLKLALLRVFQSGWTVVIWWDCRCCSAASLAVRHLLSGG